MSKASESKSNGRVARKKNAQSQDKVTSLIIVDDHPIVRKGMVMLINQEQDLNVVAEAEDYHQGIAAVKEHSPDLAVVDLTLKDIGGLELIKQLHTTHPDLPILVLSMHDESLYAQRVLRAGARGYVMKQVGADKLITAIRTVMRGDIYVSQDVATRLLGQLAGGANDSSKTPLENLSDRELEVFELLGKGLGTRQVAERLCVSIKTVESHREHIKDKLGLKNAAELIQHATQYAIRQDG